MPRLEILSCVSIVQRSGSHAHTEPPGGQRRRTLAEIQPKLNGRLQEMSNEWQLDSACECDGKVEDEETKI